MVTGLVLTRSRMGNVAFVASLTGVGCFYLLAVRKLSGRTITFFARPAGHRSARRRQFFRHGNFPLRCPFQRKVRQHRQGITGPYHDAPGVSMEACWNATPLFSMPKKLPTTKQIDDQQAGERR